MRVLRFIWRGALAFDRIGSRIPQLIQMWLLELFFAMPLTFFIAKLIDIRGGFGVPGTGEAVPGVFWGALVVSLGAGFFFGALLGVIGWLIIWLGPTYSDVRTSKRSRPSNW